MKCAPERSRKSSRQWIRSSQRRCRQWMTDMHFHPSITSHLFVNSSTAPGPGAAVQLQYWQNQRLWPPLRYHHMGEGPHGRSFHCIIKSNTVWHHKGAGGRRMVHSVAGKVPHKMTPVTKTPPGTPHHTNRCRWLSHLIGRELQDWRNNRGREAVAGKGELEKWSVKDTNTWK